MNAEGDSRYSAVAAGGKGITPRTIQSRDQQMRLGSGEATADKAMVATRFYSVRTIERF
jgi:uncharacterized protein (UPF0548 family)